MILKEKLGIKAKNCTFIGCGLDDMVTVFGVTRIKGLLEP